jgi:hypothetical protein
MAMPNAKVQMPNVVAGTALIIRYSAFALPNSVCAVNSGYALADTNRMRIALDARTIYRMVRRGTGKNLIDLYRTIARMRPDWHVIAYHRTPEGGDELFGVLDEPNIEPRQIEMPGDRIHAWGRWRLPMAAWRDGADLLHCPANLCPTWMPVPTLVTIHDLIPLDMPDGRPGGDLRLFEQSVKTACRRAAGIVTPSAYTRDSSVSSAATPIASPSITGLPIARCRWSKGRSIHPRCNITASTSRSPCISARPPRAKIPAASSKAGP